MSLIYFRNDDEIADTPVSDGHPLPVAITQQAGSPIAATPELWISEWVTVPYGATSGAIDANDALGDMVTFTESVTGQRLPTRGRILSIFCLDRDDDTLAATIHVFNRTFVAAASDAAFTISVADARNWVTSETFGTPIDIGAAKVVVAKNVNVEYYAEQNQLFAQLSSTGTPNLADATTTPLLRLVIQPLV